ncbi:hypothetical protein QAD02_016262 [Eretmocerus hayati]|uniref:Uncharacterized protein n=1 Tax=Eretmocerus hayati TaxID=131215 RepID=A0ACC2PFC7_9HYME|nr:hypothetical protein QAD02_016262 [Eretmocerus hayati]
MRSQRKLPCQKRGIKGPTAGKMVTQSHWETTRLQTTSSLSDWPSHQVLPVNSPVFLCTSPSVEDRLLMNNGGSNGGHQQHQSRLASESNNSSTNLNNCRSSSQHGSNSGPSRHQHSSSAYHSHHCEQRSQSHGRAVPRRRNNSDSSESGGQLIRGYAGGSCRRASECSESMPRSNSASVERFSIRANCDSSDFSRACSTSNERFHSDFSIAALASVTSSNERVSVPSSEPFSIRNLDFVNFNLPHADSSGRLSARTQSDRCSEERFSEIFSTRNSDWSARNSTDFRTQSEEEHFSDDSLEELLPPPPALSKRHSIAWEVSLDDEPLYVPGSTKVVGSRRRRKSSDVSSVGSASKLRDFDDWQDPRVSTTDDDLISPYSDSSTNDLDNLRFHELSKSGTYVIRRGRKKERRQLLKSPTKSLPAQEAKDDNNSRQKLHQTRRLSNTFDNIQSLLKESDKLDALSEPPAEFANSQPDLLSAATSISCCSASERNDESVPPAVEKRRSIAQREPAPLPEDYDTVLEPKIEQQSQRHEKSVDTSENETQQQQQPKITSFAEKTSECNGITITSSKSLDVSKAASLIVDEVPTRRAVASTTTVECQQPPQPQPRSQSKIPVNLLIEDQIVKKALNENRRQLEAVSDAIKEIESAKNGDSLEHKSHNGIIGLQQQQQQLLLQQQQQQQQGSAGRRLRNGDLHTRMQQAAKRNSFDSDSNERRKLLDVSVYDCRQPVARRSTQTQVQSQQPPQPPPHATDLVDGTGVKGAIVEHEFDARRRINGPDVYSSGRRTSARHGEPIENHKNDTRQIENVIDAILEDSKNPDFQVSVEVLEFPPLPPSPVEEADEESSDVGGSGSGCNGVSSAASKQHVSSSVHNSVSKSKPGHVNRATEYIHTYRPRVPPHRGISLDSSTRDHQTSSLNTRSMDAGYSRGRRTSSNMANSRREVPVERRTLPTDLPGPSRRRPFSKRHSPSTEACSSVGNGTGVSVNGSGAVPGTGSVLGTNGGSGMQTSCSLPETPVFARGSDIPRTPQHATGTNPTATATQPRRQPGWYAPTAATTGSYRRNNPGLEQAIIGTELLRLAGGPNRGWYPTRKSGQQQPAPRPASIEHLERLNSAYEARLPGAGIEQRKPLTLPTNITPNKYFGQSKHSSSSSTREALRRVTSLLIKKGK